MRGFFGWLIWTITITAVLVYDYSDGDGGLFPWWVDAIMVGFLVAITVDEWRKGRAAQRSMKRD